jgi:hypothetical protein
LTTFPDAKAGVAVLCNGANANADVITYTVADRMLADQLEPRVDPRSTHVLSNSESGALVGLYRDVATGVPSRIIKDGDRLRLERGGALYAESGSRLRSPNGQEWVFADGGRVTVTDAFGRVNRLERVMVWSPTTTELGGLVGDYASGEAETGFTAAIVGGSLVLRQRPDRVFALTPLYENAFSSSLGTVRFLRDAGRVTGMTVTQDRVWLLRFPKSEKLKGNSEK